MCVLSCDVIFHAGVSLDDDVELDPDSAAAAAAVAKAAAAAKATTKQAAGSDGTDAFLSAMLRAERRHERQQQQQQQLAGGGEADPLKRLLAAKGSNKPVSRLLHKRHGLHCGLPMCCACCMFCTCCDLQLLSAKRLANFANNPCWPGWLTAG
jgi:hypothetical protein